MSATMDFQHAEFLDLEMSNFDHSVDEGLDEALRAKPGEVVGCHYGWNFCGYIWFANDRFYEQVNVYGAPVATISADSLDELMQKVNDEYGWD